MTVSSNPTVNTSTGNGATTVFPYSFRILAAADLEVSIDGVVKTLNVDYTVDGVGNDAGGNVTFTVAPANGTKVIRRRNMALTRSTDYQDNGDLLAATLNPDQDAPVMMLQQVQEEVDRSLKIPVGESNPMTLPAAADRALKGLVFDASGNVQVSADLYDLSAALTQAQTNANTATTQAGIATTQANTATTQAGIATTQANNAAASATTASGALSSANIFGNTTDGLAATSGTGATNRYFTVPSATLNGYLDLYRNDSGVASPLGTYPSLSAINAYIDSVNKSAYHFGRKTATFVLGKSTDPATGSAQTATYTMANPVPRACALTGVKFDASGTGTLKLKRCNSAGVEQSNVVVNVVAGLNTFTTKDLGDFEFAAGEIVGWYSDKGYLIAGSDTRAAYYNGGGTDTTTPSRATLVTSFVPQIQFTFSYTPTDVTQDATNNAFASRASDESKVVYRFGHQGDTIPDGTGAAGTGHNLFIDPVPADGRIAKLRAYMGAQGYVTIWRFTRSGDTATQDTNFLDMFLMPAGYSEITLDLPLSAGDMISVQSPNFRQSNTRFAGRGYHAFSGTTRLLDGSTLANNATTLHVAVEVECRSTVSGLQKHRVKLGRTECIGVPGNSYHAGAYHPYKKTPIALASQMSAWNWRNFSVTSQDNGNRLAAMRSGACDFYSNSSDGNAYGTSSNGATWRDYGITHVLIPLATNSASAADLQADLHDELETVRAAGAMPLFITEVAPNTWYQAAVFRQFAEKYGGLYLGDLTSILTKFPQTQAAFDRAGHKAMRVTSAHYGQSIVRAVEAVLGAPRTGLKVFRPRPGFSYAVAADLMYDAYDDLQYSKGVKWQEIEIGGGFVLVGDANIGYMDNIAATASYTTTSQRYSEYDALQLGHALNFTDFALVSAHLDAQPQAIREARFFCGTGHTAVYARSPFTGPSVTYAAGNYPAAGAQQGFWHSLPLTSDGYAIVREWEINGKVSNTGRIDFLIEHAGAFTLQKPEVVWWGEAGKARTNPVSLARPRGSELISTPKPYSSGALASGWTSTGAPTFANTANGGDLPVGCTGYARLTSADTISFGLTGIAQPSDPYDGREIELAIWCCAERALVDGTTYPTGASMTNDTADWEQVTVENVSGSNSALVTKTVMPYWQEIRVKSWLVAGQTSMTVRLGCATSGAVLVARASCKLVDG